MKWRYGLLRTARFFTPLGSVTRTNLQKNLLYFFVGYFTMMAALFVYGIIMLEKKIEVAQAAKEQRIKEYSYWVSVIEQHPNYPDAYYNAALHAYALNNPTQARVLLDNALVLDPRFTEAIILLEKIEKE